MAISFDLPDGLADDLAARWGDLSVWAKESFIAHGYQTGKLTTGQVCRLLALETRAEAEQWLAERGVFPPLGHEELDDQRQVLGKLFGSRS